MYTNSLRREIRGRIPEKCPMLQECEELVDKNWFQYRCSSRDWIYCLPPKVREHNKEHYKKPREWSKKEG
jgi:hypothetical protein